MNTTNPFHPPTELDRAISIDRNAIHREMMPTRPFLLRWALVTCLNAVVPMIFATAVVDSKSYWVVLMGLVLVFFIGACVCIRVTKLRRPILVGSYVLGVSQLFPIIHIFVGAFAMQVSQSMGLADKLDDAAAQEMSNPLSILLVILVTAGMLAIVALAMGAMLTLLIDQVRFRRSMKKDD